MSQAAKAGRLPFRWVPKAWKEIPNIVIARSGNILLDQKGKHKSVWETAMGEENHKLLLLKNIPGFDDISAEDITEWMANDEINGLIENDIVKVLTEGEISEGKDLKDCSKNLIRLSQGFKTI